MGSEEAVGHSESTNQRDAFLLTMLTLSVGTSLKISKFDALRFLCAIPVLLNLSGGVYPLAIPLRGRDTVSV